MNEEPQPSLASLKELIEKNLEIAKENNRLIKAMRRDALIGGLVKTLIWIILIVGSFYLSFQFLAPYLAILENVQSGGGGFDFEGLMQQYQEFIR